LIRQIIDSDRRRRYVEHFRDSQRLTERQSTPGSGVFSPFAAAALQNRSGAVDEAMWLVFLATHFGHHPKAHWRYVDNVYGRLGTGRWDWGSVSADTGAFRTWLADNIDEIKGSPPNGFGNHRKRESLNDDGTGRTVETYVTWIGPTRGHERAFAEMTHSAQGDPNLEFDLLFRSMDVHRFGRLGKFDYLTTAHRLGLSDAVAGRPYLPGSTGPLAGARLLFGQADPKDLEQVATQFGNETGISFAVLEDAVCNWQKSPASFRRFA
jgi:hypothetical protein